jgi:two-component system, cell cycle response regulator CpdR
VKVREALRQSPFPMKRILLAEDDDSLRNFLVRALERAGYEVVSCPDGDAALRALDGGPWDLLLTDIVMPGADGIEVARQAAAGQQGLRIMFITGFAAVALAAGERAPPGARVLSKPVHLREIVTEVERMLAA